MSRCLLIKNDGIGDLVLARGIVNFLSERFSGELDLVCCGISKEIVARHLDVRRAFYVSRDPHFLLPPVDTRAPLRYPKHLLKAMLQTPDAHDREVCAELADHRYEVAIVLRRFIRQSAFYFMRAVSADEKICLWQYPTNLSIPQATRLSNGWVRYTAEHTIVHETEYYAQALSSRFPGTPSAPVGAMNGTGESNPDTRLALILGNVRKGLPPEVWRKAMLVLIADGFEVEIFGGDDTAREYDSFASAHGVVMHAGSLSLVQSAEMIASRFSVIVGNDTGLTHLTVDADKKTIVFCAGETPRRFFPWPGAEAESQFIVHKGLPCLDCGHCTRLRRVCTDIDSTSVTSVVRGVVSGEYAPGIIELDAVSGCTYGVANRWVSGVQSDLGSS